LDTAKWRVGLEIRFMVVAPQRLEAATAPKPDLTQSILLNLHSNEPPAKPASLASLMNN
jgi:hypothetical protein